MTFTYNSSPDTTTVAGRRDAVRSLVGDTNSDDPLLQDSEIDFFVTDSSNDVYSAGAKAARAIAAQFSRIGNTRFDSVQIDFSQQRQHFLELAQRLEKTAKFSGSTGLGVPVGGGISRSEILSVEEDTDRNSPAFKENQFSNPDVTVNDEFSS